MQNIDYLCTKSKSRTWNDKGWQKVVVCIVSDGRQKIHPRTLACIQKLGCYQPGPAKNVVNGKAVTAHVYEYTTQLRVNSKLQIVPGNADSVPVQLLFCLKERNQKKLNSHRWFFNAFGQILVPNVCVLIDVGTQPGPHSIYHLWKSFDLNSEVGGACGEIVALKGRYWSTLAKNPLVAAQNFEVRWLPSITLCRRAHLADRARHPLLISTKCPTSWTSRSRASLASSASCPEPSPPTATSRSRTTLKRARAPSRVRPGDLGSQASSDRPTETDRHLPWPAEYFLGETMHGAEWVCARIFARSTLVPAIDAHLSPHSAPASLTPTCTSPRTAFSAGSSSLRRTRAGTSTTSRAPTASPTCPTRSVSRVFRLSALGSI